AKTGKKVGARRLGGEYSASPLYADGRIYFFSQDGKTTAIEPGREMKVLGESKLEEGFMASPAVSGKALILRTKSHLYRIEARGCLRPCPDTTGPVGPNGIPGTLPSRRRGA